MTRISKKVHIDKFYDIVNKKNNAYHGTIKMKPIDVNWSTYIDFNVENNDKDTKFEIGEKCFCKWLRSIGLMKTLWLKNMIILAVVICNRRP